MPARRFFTPGVRAAGDAVEIGGSDARKIVRVLRLRAGDAIEVVDSAGTLFPATIESAGAQVSAQLGVPAVGAAMPGLRVDLAQAVPKGSKMDFVVEKATELGAGAILPFRSERTVGDAGDAKVERWRRLAAAAAAQCGRRDVPPVSPVLPSFAALLAEFAEYDAVALAWELATHEPLHRRLPAVLRGARRALIVVGPEGGFTHEEAEAAAARGAQTLWLGPRILRTETAALVLLAVIDALGPELTASASYSAT